MRKLMLWLVCVGLVLLPQPAGVIAGAQGEDSEILRALDRFMAGWNSRDVRQYAAALHFPHLILEASAYVEYVTEAEFIAVGPSHWARVPPQWDHSVWEERRIVQRIDDTVHATGRWARVDKSGRVLQRAEVLYVITKKGDRWAIFARSGGRRQVPQ